MTVLSGNEVVVVAPEGQIDLHNAGMLRQAILSGFESDTPGVVLDLTGVEFLDSAGIGILVGAYRRALATGKTFRLTGAGQRVQRVLDLSGLPSVV